MIGNIWIPGMAPVGLALAAGNLWSAFLRTPHGFKTIPPKSAVWECKLKCESCVREILKDFSGGIRVTARVVDGRVRRRV